MKDGNHNLLSGNVKTGYFYLTALAAAIVIFGSLALTPAKAGKPNSKKAQIMNKDPNQSQKTLKTESKGQASKEVNQKVIFAAGCFWGVQAAFDDVNGVKSTIVGYTGGHTINPTYRQVCSNTTGHAEAVFVVFDPNEVSYQQLLSKFFEIHDPTTLNRQGPDVGSQYRSAIFYFDENQRKPAVETIEKLQKSGKYKKPIVTEIARATIFYPAEEYHQKYLQKKGLSSCHIPTANNTSDKINFSDEQLRKMLSPLQYEVTQNKATEPAFTGKYDKFYENGVYRCAVCGNRLFSSESKFDSGCGWPAFYEAASDKNIEKKIDTGYGMVRTEVICSHCGAHLGHLFNDAPQTPTGMRYCINSAALNFEKEK